MGEGEKSQTRTKTGPRAHLIDLLGAVGRLQRADQAFRHQHQEAGDVVQRLAAVDLGLGDDGLGLGRAGGADDGHARSGEEKNRQAD